MEKLNYEKETLRRHVKKIICKNVSGCKFDFDGTIEKSKEAELQNLLNSKSYASSIEQIAIVTTDSPVFCNLNYLLFFKYNDNYQMLFVTEDELSNNLYKGTSHLKSILLQLPNIDNNRKARKRKDSKNMIYRHSYAGAW